MRVHIKYLVAGTAIAIFGLMAVNVAEFLLSLPMTAQALVVVSAVSIVASHVAVAMVRPRRVVVADDREPISVDDEMEMLR